MAATGNATNKGHGQGDTQYRVIGTRPVRPDGTDKVTGRARFGADVVEPGMLYGRVLRSPHAHARVKRIDVSKARELPGVLAVITAADAPHVAEGELSLGELSAGARYMADNMLASGNVLYHGHALAAVAATDPHIAEDALELIEVDYEELRPVLDVREAMLDGAPILHEGLRTRLRAADVEPPPDEPTNVAMHMRLQKGDVEQGFAEADVIVEREYETNMFHQGYLEPQTATAFWSRDGDLTIWTSTQGSFGVRDQVATLLRVPVSQVRVVPMEMGGGFGGKGQIYLEPLAALLSRETGRTVKMTMTRTEVFQATGPASATYSRVRIGARRDGAITAAQAYFAYGAGAYPGSSVGAGAMCSLAPYAIDNQLVDAYDVVVNRPKTGAYRAPGAPAAEFAVEAAINELAERLDMDPMDLRLLNAAEEGKTNTMGMPWPAIGARDVMQAIKDHPHYNSELQGENVGRGVALGFWFNGGMESSSTATVNADGTVSLVLGSVDVGGTRASLAMQLAESLGVDLERIRPHIVDTDSVGYTAVTGGSRTTFAGGIAAYELGQNIRKALVERAARIWDTDADGVTYGDDGVLRGPADADGKAREMSFEEIAGRLSRSGGMLTTSVTVSPRQAGPAFAGHIVDVEVDPETGKVGILRYTAVQDVGKAIHPAYVEGQIQGAVAQGVGMALSEEYYYDSDGRLQNASFLDYRMPTALDLPMIDTVLVEVPNPGHPYGVRGVGEVPIIPAQPAVQQAIYDATGVRLTQTPMSPRVLLEELLDDEEEE